MDVRTDTPYWLMKNGYIKTFSSLKNHIKTDTAVLGAGITGSLAAYMLGKAGVETVVLEKKHVGMGSTCASTALLQYEIDEPLHTLLEKTGIRRAVESYLACYQAIDTLAEIIENEGIVADFMKIPSLQYASKRRDKKALKQEVVARREIGINVDWMEPEDIERNFYFSAPGAILSKQAARVDPYRLAHGLLDSCRRHVRIYDKTFIDKITPDKTSVTLESTDGYKVTARKLIIACGYESVNYVPKELVKLNTTYAVATKPLRDNIDPLKDIVVWETKTPYLYARLTSGNRIIAGGRDDEMNNPRKRDRLLASKSSKLLNDIHKMLPHLFMEEDFSWAGTFGETRDSLPYIGKVPGWDHTYAILGLGGNGILFSVIGAEIVRDLITGKGHPLSETFIFDR